MTTILKYKDEPLIPASEGVFRITLNPEEPVNNRLGAPAGAKPNTPSLYTLSRRRTFQKPGETNNMAAPRADIIETINLEIVILTDGSQALRATPVSTVVNTPNQRIVMDSEEPASSRIIDGVTIETSGPAEMEEIEYGGLAIKPLLDAVIVLDAAAKEKGSDTPGSIVFLNTVPDMARRVEQGASAVVGAINTIFVEFERPHAANSNAPDPEIEEAAHRAA